MSALPASSPIPCTVFQTPGGRPTSCAISLSRLAVNGENSAGLCTTVQPAASAGAIFQVDSMNGVFHGVMIPTGPIGTRLVTFICPGQNIDFPSCASTALSAKKRKFSAPRNAAFDIKRKACPVSRHSIKAISSARSTIASAMRCSIFFRSTGAICDHSRNASREERAARSISAAVPSATWASGAMSIGDAVSKVRLSAAAIRSPATQFCTPFSLNRCR